MTRLSTKRTAHHAGVVPTVYLETGAGRTCVDYDAKTARVEPRIGGCWWWHGLDGGFVVDRLVFTRSRLQCTHSSRDNPVD
jgi:hypothetical protein